MILKGALCLVAICLLQFTPCYCTDDDLLVDNLVEDDLKDAELEDITTPAAESENGDCSPAARRNTDEYIDKVLEEVRPKLPEPAFLPDRVGRFRLFNGTLFNLSSMKRAGPALVRCADNTFSFLVPVGLQNLTGKYFWETDAGVPVFRGFIDMMIGSVNADVLYTRIRDPEEGQSKARVDRLTITKLQGVRVKFDGLGPLNAFVSRLTDLAARFFSRGVSRALEGPVRSIINKELKNVEKYEKYF